MSVLRFVPAFVLFLLLDGHVLLMPIQAYAASDCPSPGAPQPSLAIPPDDDGKCYYHLTITKVADDGWVKGKVARKALEKNKKDNPGEDIDKYPPSQYEFHVQNSGGLNPGNDYEFVGVPGTTDLSCKATPCVALP